MRFQHRCAAQPFPVPEHGDDRDRAQNAADEIVLSQREPEHADPDETNENSERRSRWRQDVVERLGNSTLLFRNRVAPLHACRVDTARSVHSRSERAQGFDDLGAPGAVLGIDVHLQAAQAAGLRVRFNSRSFLV